MRLSLAMACSSRGAPVSDCSPAPSVESVMPACTTILGSATSAVKSAWLLRVSRSATAPKKTTDIR